MGNSPETMADPDAAPATLENMSDSPHLSPALAAMMCDGMGWFSRLDYKRMLLVYDQIYYLSMANWQTGLSAVVFEVLILLPGCATSLSYSFI